MGWKYPSKEEAQECYDSAKKKYDEAAEEYLTLKNTKGEIDDSIGTMYMQGMETSSRLGFLERKIKDLNRILLYLGLSSYDISGSMLSFDLLNQSHGIISVEKEIDKCRAFALVAQDAMKNCVVCDGIQSPSFGESFNVPGVEYNAYSKEARDNISMERAVAYEEYSQLKKKYNSDTEAFDELLKRSKALENEMYALKKKMDSYAFDMDHYKKYI